MLRSDAARRDRRWVVYSVAGVILGCGALDLLLFDGVPWGAFAVRLAWAGLFVVYALVLPRLRGRSLDTSLAITALGTCMAWVSLSAQLGGGFSPYFWWMLVLPLLYGTLAPDTLPAATTAGVGTVVANNVLLAAEEADAAQHALWSVISLTTAGLAVIAVLTYRRLLANESRQERSRARAEQELAISEQRRAHAEKLALIGRLAAGIVHEINNPLAYVKANIEHLHQDPGALRTQLAELLGECQLGIGRIEEIVADLNSFARTDDAPVGSCDLPGVLAEAERLASVRTRRVAQVQILLPAGLPAVAASRTRLVQVFVNLLVNAADSLAEGRGRGRLGLIQVEAFVQDDLIEVRVVDNGPGIPAEALPRLFDPFFTTKAAGEGTGLGLPLAREFVERFGGTLTAENAGTGGACFRVRLRHAQAYLSAA